VDGLKLLKQAQEAGLSITLNSDGQLRMRGPKSAASIVEQIKENKAEVIGALRISPDIQQALIPDHTAQVQTLIDRMRKGIDWFMGVDSKMWDAQEFPISGRWTYPDKDKEPNHMVHSPTKLEVQFAKSLALWSEMDRTLHNLFEYEGCIYDSGSCPEGSIVKCMGCE